MLLLDALYINNSGGKVLLDQLVKALHESGVKVFYLLDARLKDEYPFLEETNTLYLDASLKARKEFYKNHEQLFVKVLCFGNIPPPIRLKAKVYTYFHQLLYLETPVGTPLKKRLTTLAKSWYIKQLKKNTDNWIVQTEYGQTLLSRKYSVLMERILRYPFFNIPDTAATVLSKSHHDFLYVSDGNPHKNHLNLLKAWERVNKVHPEWVLHVTVSNNYPELALQISQLKEGGLNIINHGILPQKGLAKLYSDCAFFVFPSLTESLGLPLIEACYYKCKILASDLEYCRAVVEATGLFDPKFSEDIANVILENGSKWSEIKDSVPKLDNLLHLLIEKLKE